MAQVSDSLSQGPDSSVDEDDRQSQGSTTTSSDPCLSRNLSSSRLNAKAPEFVPRTTNPSSSSPRTTDPTPTPLLFHHQPNPAAGFGYIPVPRHGPGPGPVAVQVQNHHYPYSQHLPVQYHNRQFYGGSGGFVDQLEVAAAVQEVAAAVQAQQQAPSVDSDHVTPIRNGLTDEATQKILNQVEYYFSDVNLATTDHLMRFINKDPEGYVPISVVASFKKIKAFTSSNSQLASILQKSAKLVVSEDGKKVRRKHPLTESEMEELQSRIVVAENLPEDHCHQNLMKIFSAVGSVKSIRTCQPQTSNGGASSASRTAKVEGMLFSYKLHAFVEYESVELAEKAVTELNEEGNWRNVLRVRLLLRRTAKSAQARVKKAGHDSETLRKEDDAATSEQQDSNQKHIEDFSQQSDTQSHEHGGEEHANDKEGGQKKSRSRGRGKGRGRPQYHHNHRGSHVGTPPSNNIINTEQPAVGKQPPGPRMPDGTRGFSLGRGKPVSANIV